MPTLFHAGLYSGLMATNTNNEDRFNYKAWNEQREAVVAQGDIAEYVYWLVENPSPILTRGAFSDEPPTHEQKVHNAFYSAALNFKGAQVQIDATDEPLASSRLVWRAKGTLRGVGVLVAEGNGAPNTDVIVVENDHGTFQTVRIAHVINIENVR